MRFIMCSVDELEIYTLGGTLCSLRLRVCSCDLLFLSMKNMGRVKKKRREHFSVIV